ncbi:MAG: DMT family transporter [Bacteroidales bacterium]|nr:DMT family transporter [Bacteroidales bacterium]
MRNRSVYLLAMTAILMWSTAGTAFKIALRSLSPAQLLFISANTAWIALFSFSFTTRKKINFKPDPNLLRSAIGGFLNPFLYYLVLLKAYTLLPAQIAQPLNYTWPVMLVILSAIFLHQSIKKSDFLAIIISFSGVIIISTQGSNPFISGIRSPLGVSLATASSIIWASFWIINVRDKRPQLEKLSLNFFFGALFITIYVILFDNLPLPDKSWSAAIYVGLTEMAIAFVCWLTALENTHNNSRISNLVFISPFLALFFIHLILNEKIYLSTPIGLVLIIGGILFQQLRTLKPTRND